MSPKVFQVLAAMRDIRQLSLSEVLLSLIEKENEQRVVQSTHFLGNLRTYLEGKVQVIFFMNQHSKARKIT